MCNTLQLLVSTKTKNILIKILQNLKILILPQIKKHWIECYSVWKVINATKAGAGTCSKSLYGEAPPERSKCLRIQLYWRIGFSLIEAKTLTAVTSIVLLCESVISVCKKPQNWSYQIHVMAAKSCENILVLWFIHI